MAAFAALKNRKSQKQREAIEDLAVKCGDQGSGVEVSKLFFRKLARVLLAPGYPDSSL